MPSAPPQMVPTTSWLREALIFGCWGIWTMTPSAHLLPLTMLWDVPSLYWITTVSKSAFALLDVLLKTKSVESCTTQLMQKDSTNIGVGIQLTHHSLGVIVRLAPRKTIEVPVPFWNSNWISLATWCAHSTRYATTIHYGYQFCHLISEIPETFHLLWDLRPCAMRFRVCVGI